MNKITIQLRVLLLALVPAIVLTLFLTTYNLNQAEKIGDLSVSAYAADMESTHRDQLRNYMQLALTSVHNLISQSGAASDPQRRQQVWDILRDLRFDDSGSDGYFFVYDMQGVAIMHGVNPALEGKNLWDFKDPDGKFLIRELVEAAKKGGGYVAYRWKDPQTGELAPKLGYATMLPGWNVMIGTGFWIHGLEQKTQHMEAGVSSALAEAMFGSVTSSVIVLVVIVIAALLVVRSISAPLKSAVAAMNDISSGDGDLTKRLQVNGSDELSQLSAAFNRFADQVQKLVGQILNSTGTLQHASGELREVMSAAEDGVRQQQIESDQVATAMYEMTTAAQEVAGSAVRASEAADNANDQVQSAQQLVQRAVSVMSGLSDQVDQGVSGIEQLSADSRQIDHVLEVIRGIAEQTNLLALNAAIEAARAGEAGRGFAVVADEVRTLASRTQQSTQEIQTTIERLQEKAGNAVTLITAINDQSESAASETRAVDEALRSINQAVATITDMNNQIATAAEQQASVSESINQNVHRIVEISEQTAEGTQRAGQTTRELQSLAEDMTDQVSGYRV
ncbi:MAG: methyl-accepting chemotaxis protein [Pseudomonadota bacterium]|nr:methyl-accepting chemotaxis protein [Pseudomonadota bacterium]